MRGAVIAISLGLGACAPNADVAATADRSGCGDSKIAGWVGKPWSDSMRAPALKASRARSLRVIAPDTVVTMDYRTDRLNIETDAQGRITRLKCG